MVGESSLKALAGAQRGIYTGEQTGGIRSPRAQQALDRAQQEIDRILAQADETPKGTPKGTAFNDTAIVERVIVNGEVYDVTSASAFMEAFHGETIVHPNGGQFYRVQWEPKVGAGKATVQRDAWGDKKPKRDSRGRMVRNLAKCAPSVVVDGDPVGAPHRYDSLREHGYVASVDSDIHLDDDFDLYSERVYPSRVRGWQSRPKSMREQLYERRQHAL